MGDVGIVVNPQSGKDLRRLTSSAGQVSDGVKVDVVRQVTAGALEAGAEQVVLAADRSNIAARAVAGFDSRIRLLEGPATGSRLDSVEAAKQLRDNDVAVVVGLGGDGTCRDLASGWPTLPLIAMSTGTNNVYPAMLNPTAVGLAAGHLAAATVAVADVSTASKRIVIDDGNSERYALVDVALVETNAVGARAVTEPQLLRWVLACRADPASTGLSAVAAQAQLCAADDDGGVLVHVGPGGRPIRAPLSPGTFHTLGVTSVVPIAEGEAAALTGNGVLAFDGERECHFVPGSVARIDRLGPQLVDIDRVLRAAVG